MFLMNIDHMPNNPTVCHVSVEDVTVLTCKPPMLNPSNISAKLEVPQNNTTSLFLLEDKFIFLRSKTSF